MAQGAIGVAQNATVTGRDVTLEIYVENLGVDGITNISMSDDLDAVFGAGNYSLNSGPDITGGAATIGLNPAFDGSSDTTLLTGGTLAEEEWTRVSMVISIHTPVDMGNGLGVYTSQVLVNARDSGSNGISDLSDEGINPDPNGNGNAGDPGEDDPTTMALFERPSVGVAQAAALNGTLVTLDFYLQNYGNVSLNNLSLFQNLDNVFGAGNYSISSAPVLIDDPGTVTLSTGFDGSGSVDLLSGGSLSLGDTAQIRMVVSVDTVADMGQGLGVYSSQALAEGQSLAGNTGQDESTNGTNPDPNGDGNPSGVGEDEPTPIVLGEEPTLGVAQTASVSGSVVTLDVYLENLGNTNLQLSLENDLNATFGEGTFFISNGPTVVSGPASVVLSEGYDGNFDTQVMDESSSLDLGASAHIQWEVTVLEILDLGNGLGVYSNQSTGEGVAERGGTTVDLSDDGTDPDPNGNGDPTEAGEDDPTSIVISPQPELGVAKQFIYDGFNGSFHQITLRMTLTNYGNQDLFNLDVHDNLDDVYGAGNYIHITDPNHVSGPETLIYNAAYNGSSNTALLLDGSLGAGETVQFDFGHWLVAVTDQGHGLGTYHNQVTAFGVTADATLASDVSHEGTDPDPDGDGDPNNNNDVTVINVNLVTALGVAKDVSVSANLVTFDLYLENLGTETVAGIGLSDGLDAVFGAGNYAISSAPTLLVDPGTIVLDAAYTGAVGANEHFVPPSSSLAPGATAHIQYQVTVINVTNQGTGLGNYSTQATVSGLATTNTLLTDLSDFGTDPDPNGDNDPSGAGEDDPTTFSLDADSPVSLAMTGAVSGPLVTYDLYLENLGPNAVDVSVTNVLDDAFGAGNYAIDTAPALISDPGTLSLNSGFDGSGDASILAVGSTLSSGATAQIQFVVDVVEESDQGSGFGVYSNQASVNAEQASGVVLVDLSDDGTVGDPNGNGDPGEAGEDDPTVVAIGGSPSIGVAQSVSVTGSLVTLEVFVENLGDVTVSNIIARNPLNGVFGSGTYSVVSQPTLVNGPSTLLLSTNYFGFSVFDAIVAGGYIRPGETIHFRYGININSVTDQGNGLGVYFDGFSVDGTAPDGAAVTDTSDDGVDPDPNGNGNANEAGENDPTQIIIGDEASIGAALTSTTSGTTVTFDVNLENLGGSALSNIALTDELDSVFGAGNYVVSTAPAQVGGTGSLVGNAGFDGSADTALLGAGSTLAVGDTAVLRYSVDVTNIVDQGLGIANYENQVFAIGTAPLGTTTEDLSDNGTEPDANGNGLANDAGEDDVTPFNVDFPMVGVAKTASTSGRYAIFNFRVQNLGNTRLDDVSLTEDLDAVFGAGNYSVAEAPVVVTPPREIEPNAAFNGSSDTEIIGSGGLNRVVGETIQLVVSVDRLVDLGSGFGVYSNQVQVVADGITDLSDDGTDPDPNGNSFPNDPGEDDVTHFTMPEAPAIALAKTASVTGDLVTFNIYVSNVGNVDLATVSVTDDLDAVLGSGNYQITAAPSLVDDPGTVTLNSSYDGSSDTALLSSGSLVWGDTAEIQMTVQVQTLIDQGLGLGAYTNQASGSATSADGTAASDLSDSGTDGDANGNGNPGDVGENDPTYFSVGDGTIGDFVYHDFDENGAHDAGEPGIAGVLVFLDMNGNGVADSNEPQATTDSAGAYDITDLGVGPYTVRVDFSTLPTGFFQTSENLPLDVNLRVSEDFNDADFGFGGAIASIGDLAFNDLDGNGVQDAGEPGLAGVTVYLDLNGNGSLDVGEPNQTTGSDGLYDFSGLSAGTYTVAVDAAPSGYTSTTASSFTVTIQAGEDYDDADFGFLLTGSIGDTLWIDANGNGVQDAGEPGIAGVTLELYEDTNGNTWRDAGEPIVASAITDSNGNYLFTGLTAGHYLSKVTDMYLALAGLTHTWGRNAHPVNLSAGEQYMNADFGYQQGTSTIGDLIWEDANGNGVVDGGEAGIAGVTISLYKDNNGNGTLEPWEPLKAVATTASDGSYLFSNLIAGNYIVVVSDKGNILDQATLTTGNLPHAVSLSNGQAYGDGDFGYCFAPTLVSISENLAGCTGEATVLSVEVHGTDLSYQWKRNGKILEGEATSELVIPSTSVADNGIYTCLITNSCGGSITAMAQLNVQPTELHVDAVAVQGLEPVTLEASVGCSDFDAMLTWEILGEGGEFGIGETSVTLPILDNTAEVRVTVQDPTSDLDAIASEGRTIVLSAQNPDFRDLDGDGCNTTNDMRVLAPEWRTFMFDANGDGRIDVRDFLYIRVDEDCEP